MSLSTSTFLIGHRGTGACEEQDAHRKKCIDASVKPPPKIRENTLKAMRTTYENGGNFVEFDVQLSKDGVPIIHHNFYTDDGTYIGDLTLEQLQAINDGETEIGIDEHRFPTLESFFTELPVDLGFDMEIKYPRYQKDGTSQCPEFDWPKEKYVNKIIAAVEKFSADSGRRMFYSCFDSELCRLFHWLHPKCPVVFLADGKNGHKFTEVEGRSANNALKYASLALLNGVAVQSEELLQHPDRGPQFVASCHNKGIQCFTWGPLNNDADNRRLQMEWGVDGIIVDNIHALGAV